MEIELKDFFIEQLFIVHRSSSSGFGRFTSNLELWTIPWK